MNLYFAPLEGITTYTFRNIHTELFGDCDAYFAPFITPSDNERVSIKSLRDILPEKNSKNKLIPQVLTCKSETFLNFTEKIKELGYEEININVGCPSSTVVKKGRGAGFLKNPVELDSFFGEIFAESDMRISVKTRLGFSSSEEMDELIKIYNKYPMESLIIHPRTRAEFYNGEPDLTAFGKAFEVSKNKICYNGNVFTANDYYKITSCYQGLDSVMIGRGAVKNPAIFREIKGGKRLKTQELIEFSARLINEYSRTLGTEVYVIHKLKEIWLYFMQNFPEEKKILKAVKKANKLGELTCAVEYLPLLECKEE